MVKLNIHAVDFWATNHGFISYFKQARHLSYSDRYSDELFLVAWHICIVTVTPEILSGHPRIRWQELREK